MAALLDHDRASARQAELNGLLDVGLADCSHSVDLLPEAKQSRVSSVHKTVTFSAVAVVAVLVTSGAMAQTAGQGAGPTGIPAGIGPSGSETFSAPPPPPPSVNLPGVLPGRAAGSSAAPPSGTAAGGSPGGAGLKR